jgi:hypothetical protein
VIGVVFIPNNHINKESEDFNPENPADKLFY